MKNPNVNSIEVTVSVVLESGEHKQSCIIKHERESRSSSVNYVAGSTEDHMQFALRALLAAADDVQQTIDSHAGRETISRVEEMGVPVKRH